MTDVPHVTIAIVNWNGKSVIQTCLETIFAHTEYPAYRIVVVDNGSEDGSVQMLHKEFPNVDIIENEKNRGFAKANNQVFNQCPETDYYLLLNNDTEITQSGWLEQFIKVAERTGAGITGCRLVYPDGTLQHGGGVIHTGHFPAENIHENNMEKLEQNGFEEEWEPNYVTGAAFLVSNEVIQDTGGFDELYSPAYYEDSDLCMRAKMFGHKIVYTEKVEIVHQGSTSTDNIPTFYFRNRLRFIIIHFPLTWIIIQLIYELRGIVSHLYNRRPLWEIYGQILLELPKLFVKRRELTTSRLLK